MLALKDEHLRPMQQLVHDAVVQQLQSAIAESKSAIEESKESTTRRARSNLALAAHSWFLAVRSARERSLRACADAISGGAVVEDINEARERRKR